MTAQTPVYGIKYPEVGEPIRTTRQILEDNAKAVEAALVSGGIAPPSASDLATLSGRVTTLEEQQWRRARVDLAAAYTYTSGDVAMNTQTYAVAYDAGPAGGANAMWDSVNKRLTCRKTGLYRVRCRLVLSGGTADANGVLRLATAGTPATAVLSRNFKTFTNETYVEVDDEVVLTNGQFLIPVLWLAAGTPTVQTTQGGTKTSIRFDYRGPAPATPSS